MLQLVKKSQQLWVVAELESSGAMEYTTVVTASAMVRTIIT